MSNYYYPPANSTPEEGAYSADSTRTCHTTQLEQRQLYPPQFSEGMVPQHQFYIDLSQYPSQLQQFQHMLPYQYQLHQQQVWAQLTSPSTYSLTQQGLAPFPRSQSTEEQHVTSPSRPRSRHISPGETARARSLRSTSFASNTSPVQSVSRSDISRSASPHASEMVRWGSKNKDGSWSCSYPGCSSRSTFYRGCDLRKHYKRHTKSLFCRHQGCPQSTESGFSSKKDRARHEAKHNPNIVCEWEGCERLFSRQDNMRDHIRRVHQRRIA